MQTTTSAHDTKLLQDLARAGQVGIDRRFLSAAEQRAARRLTGRGLACSGHACTRQGQAVYYISEAGQEALLPAYADPFHEAPGDPGREPTTPQPYEPEDPYWDGWTEEPEEMDEPADAEPEGWDLT